MYQKAPVKWSFNSWPVPTAPAGSRRGCQARAGISATSRSFAVIRGTFAVIRGTFAAIRGYFAILAPAARVPMVPSSTNAPAAMTT